MRPFGGLEYTALWVNQRNPLAPEVKAGAKIGCIEKPAITSGKPVHAIEGNLPQLSVAWRRKHRRHPHGPL